MIQVGAKAGPDGRMCDAFETNGRANFISMHSENIRGKSTEYEINLREKLKESRCKWSYDTLNQFERQNQPAIVDVADVEEAQEVAEQGQSQNLNVESFVIFSLSDCYFNTYQPRRL